METHPLARLRAWLVDWLNYSPPKNVWIGTSVENQAAADERIPHLLRVPAAVRFLSVEPLLGAVDLNRVLVKASDAPGYGKPDVTFSALRGWHGGDGDPAKINWVIVGGESGHGARPFDLAWGRLLRDQCKAVGVPFFFKQTGSNCEGMPRGGKGGTLEDIPADLRVREFPKAVPA